MQHTRAGAPYRASLIDLIAPIVFVVAWLWVFTWDLDSVPTLQAVASPDVTDTAAP